MITTPLDLAQVISGAMAGWLVCIYLGAALKATVPVHIALMGAFIGATLVFTVLP